MRAGRGAPSLTLLGGREVGVAARQGPVSHVVKQQPLKGTESVFMMRNAAPRHRGHEMVTSRLNLWSVVEGEPRNEELNYA